VGVGAGDPEHITVAAIRALGEAEVIFELDRATADLTHAREVLVARYAESSPRIVRVAEPLRDRTAADYSGAVQAWRSARARAWEKAIADELGADGCGAFLVWGDPSLYDSTIAVLEELAARGAVTFTYEVIPGISSLHALTARHRIMLNRVGGEVLITTGRRLADHGLPGDVTDAFVMLDAGCVFLQLIDQPLEIYWGAYLGTQDEILLSGPLAEVAEEIERVRGEARERKGWIMDCYLLRRP
jgi:precorrin-6A synthase